jgi:hypothetical protein
MHHVGHVDWDFSEPPAGYAGSAAGYSSSCLVGSHNRRGAYQCRGYASSSFQAAAPV